MDDYKWFKDDFENNIENDRAKSESSDYSANEYKDDTTSDYNTSGESYADYSFDDTVYDGETFYNATVKSKKSRKRIPAYAAIIAVILTAALSVSGTVYIPKLVSYISLRNDNSGDADVKNGETKGSAVVNKSASAHGYSEILSTPEIVDKVGPAVVGIINKAEVIKNPYGFGFGYGFYGGGTEVEQSSGSGVIISEDGYVVTNNHVIEGAKEIVVILNTNEEYKARLVGTDTRTDLAVLKIDAKGLTFAKMGKSSDLRVGDTAIAIGNPLGQEFAGTTTQGIISGLNRSVTIEDKQLNLIQTDAAINPGNSGGALVNAYGHLIGINTAKISSSTLEGLGFAIPIDEAKPIISDLIDSGYVRGRPVIGIGGRAVTEEDAKAYNLVVGVYVSSMTPDSPAYMAGIKIGDIIVKCAGKKVTTVEEINDIKNRYQPGEKLELEINRQGQTMKITIVLGEEMPGAN